MFGGGQGRVFGQSFKIVVVGGGGKGRVVVWFGSVGLKKKSYILLY